MKTLDIALTLLTPNPDQPRHIFEQSELAALADSIRSLGVLQPLLVQPDGNGGFVVIAGERRLRAAELAKLPTVPCVVQELRDESQGRLIVALTENLLRADLSPVEQARGFERLATEFGLSDAEIGKRFGLDRSTVANKRRLLKLPEEILGLVGEGAGLLPEGQARQLIPLARTLPRETTAAAKRMASGKSTLEREAWDLVRKTQPIKADWDLNWLKTPATARDSEGELAVRDCKGCEHFIQLRQDGGRYCAWARCYGAKVGLYVEHELSRVSKKLGVPAAAPDETVTVIDLDWRNEERVRQWLQGPASHLRLVRAPEHVLNERDHESNAYSRKQLLGTNVLDLATTAPSLLNRTEKAETGVAEDESEGAKERRAKQEEKLRQARRAGRAEARKQAADVDWLGIHTAEILAPQVQAGGATLAWLAGWVASRTSVARAGNSSGHWPALERVISANAKEQKREHGQELERRQRESVLLHLLHEAIRDFDPKQQYRWSRAREHVSKLAGQLGLKLPKGWDAPPVHHTDANCWNCGQFTGYPDRITKVEEAEGWRVSGNLKNGGHVACSDRCDQAYQKRVGRKAK